MKNLLIAIAIVFSVASSAATVRGTIDLSSNSVTTSYESLLAITTAGKVRRIACTNSSSSAVWISLSGTASDCSDADEDWLLGATGNGAFAFDNFPMGNRICVKTTTGTASSGFIHCVGWWNEVTP